MLPSSPSILSKLRQHAARGKDEVRAWLSPGPSPVVLMYHRVADEAFDPWGLAVTPERFKEQLEWLAEHRTLLSLAEFADLHRRTSLPSDAVAVTFDDGYACVGETAGPLLRQLGIPATVFVPVDLIERREPFWWDELEEIVLAHDAPTLFVDEKKMAIGEVASGDRHWAPRTEPKTVRQTAFLDILTLITRKKPGDRDRIMRELRSEIGQPVNVSASKRPLTPEQVRELAGGAVEFGSHTRTHPWLTDLSPDEQKEEIHGSMDRLHALTGYLPRTFAYPYGTWDDCSRRLVEDAGFAGACVTGDRAISNRCQSTALTRVRVGNWSALELEQALSGLLLA